VRGSDRREERRSREGKGATAKGPFFVSRSESPCVVSCCRVVVPSLLFSSSSSALSSSSSPSSPFLPSFPRYPPHYTSCVFQQKHSFRPISFISFILQARINSRPSTTTLSTTDTGTATTTPTTPGARLSSHCNNSNSISSNNNNSSSSSHLSRSTVRVISHLTNFV